MRSCGSEVGPPAGIAAKAFCLTSRIVVVSVKLSIVRLSMSGPTSFTATIASPAPATKATRSPRSACVRRVAAADLAASAAVGVGFSLSQLTAAIATRDLGDFEIAFGGVLAAKSLLAALR